MRLIRSRIFRFVYIAGCLILIVSLLLSIGDVLTRRGIVGEYEEALAEAKAENERLKRELATAQTPEFIEREIRNKLGYVREGEALVLIDDSKASTRDSPPESGNERIPTWEQWRRLFF